MVRIIIRVPREEELELNALACPQCGRTMILGNTEIRRHIVWYIYKCAGCNSRAYSLENYEEFGERRYDKEEGAEN